MARKMKVKIVEDSVLRYIDISYQPTEGSSELSEEDVFPITEEFADALREVINNLAQDRRTIITFNQFPDSPPPRIYPAEGMAQFDVAPPKPKKQ